LEARSPVRVMSARGRKRQDRTPMRQLPGRNPLMLQWNAKLVVVVVVLIVLAAVLGIASCDPLNFTW